MQNSFLLAAQELIQVDMMGVYMKCENGLDLLRVAPITVLVQVILEGKENKSSIKNILFTYQVSFFFICFSSVSLSI